MKKPGIRSAADRVFDITALGESLVDFVQAGAEDGALRFAANAGGAPANLLSAAAKFGMRCALISKVGEDVFGHYLQQAYQKAGIDVSALVFSPDSHTTLSVVSLDAAGDRDFFFYRNATADSLLCRQDVSVPVLEKTRLFHFGSISMTTPCGREATRFAARTAKAQGALISFDPNYRAPLWSSPDEAKDAFREGCRMADFIKLSEAELPLLSGETEIPAAARDVMQQFHPAILVVTLGEKGAFCLTDGGSLVQAEAYEVDTVDTTGAGDAFFGAFLAGILRSGKRPEALDGQALSEILNLATACGSLSTARYGAIPAMPEEAEVSALVRNRCASR